MALILRSVEVSVTLMDTATKLLYTFFRSYDEGLGGPYGVTATEELVVDLAQRKAREVYSLCIEAVNTPPPREGGRGDVESNPRRR